MSWVTFASAWSWAEIALCAATHPCGSAVVCSLQVNSTADVQQGIATCRALAFGSVGDLEGGKRLFSECLLGPLDRQGSKLPRWWMMLVESPSPKLDQRRGSWWCGQGAARVLVAVAACGCYSSASFVFRCCFQEADLHI